MKLPRYRLINCDFINAGSFSNNLTNKAKLLYLNMFINGDDCGFVDQCEKIIESLTNNENKTGQVSLELLNNDYHSALEELGNAGLLYRFTDNHYNTVYLIRHWFMHNKWKQGLRTNYSKYRAMVDLQNYEYHLKKESDIKKVKIKENNLIQDKPNQESVPNWDYLVEELSDDETNNT